MVIMIQVPLFYSDRVLGDGENVLRSPHPQAVRKGDSTIQRQRRQRRVVEEVRHSNRLYRSSREWSQQEFIVASESTESLKRHFSVAATSSGPER